MIEPGAAPAQSFAKAGTVMFVGNAAAGVFAYVLQIVMGRMLAVQDYSLFTALFGVFNITAVPLAAILLVVTRNVALEMGAGRIGTASAVRAQALRELGIFGGVGVLLGLLLSGPLASLVGAPSVVPVVILWLAVGANLFTVLGGATLQGLQRFRALAATSAGITALRLALCAGLVAGGLGVSGAMGGLLLSLAAGAVAFWWAVEHGLPRHANDGSTRPLFASREALLLATSNLAFIALTQIDYIIVRVFCSPEQASLYAAGAVLAKSVLWLPVGIALALFPTVASHYAGRRPSRHLLRQSLGMAFLTSGALTAVLAIGADFWMTHLYGPDYSAAAPYLRWLSLIYLPLALVMVIDNYFLALRRARFVILFALGAAAQFAVFAYPGGTPERLVWALAAASTACGIWAVWVVATDSRRDTTPKPARGGHGDAAAPSSTSQMGPSECK